MASSGPGPALGFPGLLGASAGLFPTQNAAAPPAQRAASRLEWVPDLRGAPEVDSVIYRVSRELVSLRFKVLFSLQHYKVSTMIHVN